MAEPQASTTAAGGTPATRTCATMPVHRRLLSDPAYVRARDAIENHAMQYEQGLRIAASTVTRIPVVVHVVWNTAEQNLSDEQVASQIDVLNRDFRRRNPDVENTPAPFLPLASDANIEFFLATSDPDGKPTNGIIRKQTSVTSFDANDAVKSAATGGSDAWPADRYLNLWACPLGGGLLGYAQFPGGPPETDGVVILQSAFGTTGTAAPPFNLGRTATHEIGHWLNLNHIWGDDGSGCSGTDNVADTPNQGGANTGKPAFPTVSCNNAPNGDMFMNYMDYVDDPAMFMFSAGQVARMQACLEGPRSSFKAAAGAGTPGTPGAPANPGTPGGGTAPGSGSSPGNPTAPVATGADPQATVPTGSWTHSFEEDEGDVRVYRPNGSFTFPPARAPRETLELHAGGDLTVHGPGPDDRPRANQGNWSTLGANRLRLSPAGASDQDIEVIEATPEILKLRRF
jgi:hypothetical protein